MPKVRIFMTSRDTGESTLLKTVDTTTHEVTTHAPPETIERFTMSVSERVKAVFEDIARQNPAAIVALAKELDLMRNSECGIRN